MTKVLSHLCTADRALLHWWLSSSLAWPMSWRSRRHKQTLETGNKGLTRRSSLQQPGTIACGSLNGYANDQVMACLVPCHCSSQHPGRSAVCPAEAGEVGSKCPLLQLVSSTSVSISVSRHTNIALRVRTCTTCSEALVTARQQLIGVYVRIACAVACMCWSLPWVHASLSGWSVAPGFLAVVHVGSHCLRVATRKHSGKF
jgi:hypothetical protein